MGVLAKKRSVFAQNDTVHYKIVLALNMIGFISLFYPYYIIFGTDLFRNCLIFYPKQITTTITNEIDASFLKLLNMN